MTDKKQAMIKAFEEKEQIEKAESNLISRANRAGEKSSSFKKKQKL